LAKFRIAATKKKVAWRSVYEKKAAYEVYTGAFFFCGKNAQKSPYFEENTFKTMSS
jgi:hypothetical protein